MCDDLGIVYAACGDGVEVWSPGGVALGVIEVPGKLVHYLLTSIFIHHHTIYPSKQASLPDDY